jgi:uncharacterized protein (DUF2141 family)
MTRCLLRQDKFERMRNMTIRRITSLFPRRLYRIFAILTALLAMNSMLQSTISAKSLPASAGTNLTLNFTIQKFSHGALMIAIYNNEGAYHSDTGPVRTLKLPVTESPLQHVVSGLAPGHYGIKLFHDVDGTGKLTFNLFGVPNEPVAFSNNAKVNMRAPLWSEVVFELPVKGTTQNINID